MKNNRAPLSLGRTPIARWWVIAIAVAAGIVAGLLARGLVSILPAPWNTLANTSALWGLVPFAVTAALRVRGRTSLVAGALALLVMVVTWVGLSPEPVSARELVLWGFTGLIAGALCGGAGGFVPRRRSLRRSAANAVMGGLVAGEALYGILLIHGPQWWFEAAVGILVPLALGRGWRERRRGVIGTLIVAGVLVGAYLLYDAIAAG